MRRRAILGSGGFALLSGSWPAQFSWAQEAAYPSRPVQMVVAIQAGGAIDVAGRTVAEAMGSRLGQTFFVEYFKVGDLAGDVGRRLRNAGGARGPFGFAASGAAAGARGGVGFGFWQSQGVAHGVLQYGLCGVCGLSIGRPSLARRSLCDAHFHLNANWPVAPA